MTENGNANNRRSNIALLRTALDVYVSGRAGVRFDALMRFAGPLFDLYDVEWRSDNRGDALSRDENELSTMVAVLDTARLLWSFFALDDDRSLEAIPELEDAMLGPSAGDEERSNLLVLLSLLEEHWQSFTAEERAEAIDTPGYALPEFEALLAEYEGRRRRLPRQQPARFGPEDLEVPEALAVFAEPLLQDPAIEGDPELVEERVERAQAYWDLATAPRDRFEIQLQRIVDAFATSDDERASIREEAELMIERFNRLFPGRTPGAR